MLVLLASASVVSMEFHPIYIISISGKCNGLFCSGAHPTTCTKGTVVTFSASNAPGTLTTNFLIVLRLKISGALSLLLHMPSWHAHRQLYPSLNIPRVIL